MSPEERELLNKTATLAEENNKMLHSMARGMRIQRVMSILYWVFIIGSAFGAYYFIQPVLGQLLETYGSAGGALDTFNATIQ